MKTKTKILKVAEYLSKQGKATAAQMKKKFAIVNPADTIMYLRNTYKWKIETKPLSMYRYAYEVKKIGSMPTR